MRVSEEMVRALDGAKQETAEGGGGAEGDEGGAPDGDFTTQLRAAAGVEPHNVSTLRARDHYHPRQDPHCRLSWSAAAHYCLFFFFFFFFFFPPLMRNHHSILIKI